MQDELSSTPYFSFDLLAFIPVRHSARRGFFYAPLIAWKIWQIFMIFGKYSLFMLTELGTNCAIANEYATIS